jgi:hypothetical protein
LGTLFVKFSNAKRKKLDDQIDVQVVAVRTNTVSASKRARGTQRVSFALTGGQGYMVRAFPRRHRPVGQMVLMPLDGPATVELVFPIHPEHATVEFPDYATLPAELCAVLDRSTLEGSAEGAQRGSALYADLTPIQRAGLLNLFAKMNAFGFDAGHTIWGAVEDVYRIRPDRIFANVDVALRDRVKAEIVEGRFREVSGSLHTPPPGFSSAGSFKTDERYGNLQLSFFSSNSAPIAFKVDADIDDAAGLGHTFQVLRNWLTDGTTHPYDIHQILTFRQEVAPLYDLA